MQRALAGRRIVIAETRELDLFAALLERRGATVLRYPLVSIVDAPDPAPVLRWIGQLAAGGMDDLILMTGEGLRRLCACAERHQPALLKPFVGQLGRVRRITRGPKPARALKALDLKPDLEADPPTTAGVIAALGALVLAGRRVGLQCYGTDPNVVLNEYLQARDATVLPVMPYVYADAAADSTVEELLAELRAGRVDAIAFTSAVQVERLARLLGETALKAALAYTQVAAVGPVVGAALKRHGIDVQAAPVDSWFMKPLTQTLVALLGGAAPGGAD